MRKFIGNSLILVVLLSAGCAPKSEVLIREPIELTASFSKIEVKDKPIQLIEGELMNLFEDYFSFTSEELLILNQLEKKMDEAYWTNLRASYSPLIKEKLGRYLEENLLEKLEDQYLYEAIHLPKWVLLNQYMVEGTGSVETLQIHARHSQPNQVIYEVSVITRNTCYPVDEFESDDGWREVVAMDLYEKDFENLKSQRYLFSEAADEMKIEQRFKVTVAEGELFKVKGIQHASSWEVSAFNKQSILDTQYITRVPYVSQVTAIEETVLKDLFTTFIETSKGTFDYYEKAYQYSATLFQKVWDNLGLGEVMEVNKENYKEAFPLTIFPYKSEVDTLKVSRDQIHIQPSIYSTKMQPRFIVSVPVEALLNNQQIVYYKYKYYVGMEAGKIEFIQFMNSTSV